MPRRVTVTCPSRLHFGLWSLASAAGRQFGGVGAMIASPSLELTVTEAKSLDAVGGDTARSLGYARHWAQFHRLPEPCCRIEVRQEIPQHAGLGSGTQLALSIAAALSAFQGLPSQTPQELAFSVSRGLRSAVGTYGFVFGGLIVEQGKLPREPISPLDCRIDLPGEWRFVLARPRGITGLAGEDEAEAFDSLPDVPPSVTEELTAVAREDLAPAAATSDFELFARSLYRYGNLSGQCFAARQGGPYNGPLLANLVEKIRALGYEGTGQSSWGPTVFAAAPTSPSAVHLVGKLAAVDDLDVVIAAPCNHGAQIIVYSDDPRFADAAAN